MESVFEIFKSGIVNCIAVLDGERLLGMCSRQETAALLDGRYGFSLWARKPIGADFHRSGESLLEAIMSGVYEFGGSKMLTEDECLVIAEL